MIKTNGGLSMSASSQCLNIGFENRVISRRIIAIVHPNSAPIKRMVKKAKENNMLVDATVGKPTRSVIVTDSRYIVLSSISLKKLSGRMEKNNHE